MKTKYYLKGKKITKKAAIEFLGDEQFNARLIEAKQTFMEDPLVEISWTDGFMIEFE